MKGMYYVVGLIDDNPNKRNYIISGKKILGNIVIKSDWMNINDWIAAIHKDKKQTSESINAVLIKKDKTLAIFKDIEKNEIEKAIKMIMW